MTYTAFRLPLRPATRPPHAPLKVEKTLDDRIAEAREYARFMTESQGLESRDTAVAWEIVDELLSVKARRPQPTPFEQYCTENPNALESRMYDV